MLIQIVNGMYGHRPTLPNGQPSDYVVPTTRFDPPINVPDEEAKRLVENGIAVYAAPDGPGVTADVPEAVTPDENTPDEKTAQNGSEGQENENDDLTDDEDVVFFNTDMKADELRAAMRERGLAIRPGMTKKEMVEALNGGSDAPVLEAEGVIDE